MNFHKTDCVQIFAIRPSNLDQMLSSIGSWLTSLDLRLNDSRSYGPRFLKPRFSCIGQLLCFYSSHDPRHSTLNSTTYDVIFVTSLRLCLTISVRGDDSSNFDTRALDFDMWTHLLDFFGFFLLFSLLPSSHSPTSDIGGRLCSGSVLAAHGACIAPLRFIWEHGVGV